MKNYKFFFLLYTIVVSAVQAEVISFTTDEGYQSGTLTSHSFWRGVPGAVVNANKGTIAMPLGKFCSLIYDKPIIIDSDQKYLLGISFRFSRDASTDTQKLPLLKLGLGEKGEPSAGIEFSRQYIKEMDKNLYAIKMYSKIAEPYHCGTIEYVEDKQVLSRSDTNSDLLHLRFVIEKGATRDTWNATGWLYTSTANALLATTTSSFTAPDKLFKNSKIFPRILSGIAHAESFLKSLTIDEFIFIPNRDDPHAFKEEMKLFAQMSKALAIENKLSDKKKSASQDPGNLQAEPKAPISKGLTWIHVVILLISTITLIITGGFFLFKNHV